MAQIEALAGATSVSTLIFIQDSSSTIGAGLSGIAPAGGSLLSGFSAYYSFAGANAAATSISLSVPATVGAAWGSGNIVELDSVHMKGWYRFDIPNAALAASKGRIVGIDFYGGTNVAPVPLSVALTGWDNQDSVRGGLSSLPNASAAASGGLPTIGATIPNATAGATGGLVIAGSNAATTFATLTTTGVFTVNGVSNVSQTGDNYAIANNITYGNQAIETLISAIPTNPLTSLGSTAPAAWINTAAFASGATVPNVTTTANLTNAPTSGDFTAAMKASLNAATPASVVGNVGGITGVTFPGEVPGTITDASPTINGFASSTGLNSTADFYQYANLNFRTGACAGLNRKISASTSGGGVSFATPLPVAPADGDQFVILGGTV